MAAHPPLRHLIQFLFFVVVVLAIPQNPDTSCYTTPPYRNTTTSCSFNSSSIEMIPSTTSPVFYSTRHSTHYSQNKRMTHYECTQYPSQSTAFLSSHASYNSKYAHASSSPHTACQVSIEFPTSSPTSMYTSTQASVSTSSSPMCTPGINVNKPGVFELWSYAPGICDLDNKVVTSSVLCHRVSRSNW